MLLKDLLHLDCVKVPLEAANKQDAIFELADLVARAHNMTDVADEFKDAIWQRERARSTGIGHGIAIPHGRIKGLDQLRLATGITKEPIPFQSLDGKPVNLLILLVSPADQTNAHIQVLARISRLLTDTSMREQIKNAADAATLHKLITEPGT